MKRVYQLFPQKLVIGLFSCFFMILRVADVSEAQFFNSKLAGKSPRTRMGCYPCSTAGTDFLDVEELGRHTYRFSFSEKNGLLYTCRGGHIDTAHLRKAADWTAFVAAKTFEQLMQNETKFTFRLMEPSRYHVEITYPENWYDLSEEQKENIAFDISIRLGEHFIYTATTWHEILTWFGYKCTGFLYPEFASAFTWEDTFSNLLGTYIAGQALRDMEHEYDEAMTLALERELEKLGVQPGQTAKRAAKKVKGQWFSSNLLFFINMKKRHFDIGLGDGFVTPSIVPSVAGCEGAEALLYPVPSLGFLRGYGFSVKFEIEPREMERGKILRVVYADSKEEKERIDPAIHFAAIMDYIKEDAVRKYGRNVDLSDISSQRPVKIAEAKEYVDPVVHLAAVEDDVKTTSRRLVKATEAKERIEPAVQVAAIVDNIKEDVAKRYDHNDVDRRDTHHQQLAKATSSPIKTYDFGFKVSKPFSGDTNNEIVFAVSLDDDSKFDIKELASMAYQWLEAVNE